MSRFLNPIFLRMRAEGRPRQEIAKALGIKISTLSDYVTDFNRWGLLAPVYVHGGRKSPSGRVELVRELWLSGMHVDDVAKRVGMHRKALESLVGYHGIKRGEKVTKASFWTDERVEQLRAMRKAGHTDDEIGLAFGKPGKTINRARRKFAHGRDRPEYVPHKKWTPEEETELVRLWNVLKLNPAEIARRMKKTKGQISGKSLRLGLVLSADARIIRKPAVRSYDSVAASNRARFGTAMKPRPKAGPKEDSNVIPLTARPWLTRAPRGECVYLYGPRGDYHSCCKPVWNDTNQCEEHFALCHDFSRSKRVAA